ncbi:putative quinol monooxygenase [Salinimicrobium sp. WS361]|uniref:putative quinol monooxygenase n=1 Tax=Salinimicrobium sp. WS361 TaxID=3425123 RepID=UPI003D6EEC64
MLIRIVKMTFEASETEDFQKLFQQHKEKIRGFEGCEFLELYRDKHNKNIFFTYSYWKSEEALENYRVSSLFKGVWSQTKKMFADKPEAWSVDKMWTSGSVGSVQF